MERFYSLLFIPVLLVSSGSVINTGTKVAIIVIAVAVLGIAGFFLLRRGK